MSGRIVQVIAVFLNILPMIALGVGQPEERFLQDRIPSVPKRKRKTEPLMVVRNSEQTVLAPSIGAGARMIEREVVPSLPVLAVILSHCSPLALTQIRSPAPPVGFVIARLVQSFLFFGQERISRQISCEITQCNGILLSIGREEAESPRRKIRIRIRRVGREWMLPGSRNTDAL